ncbi:MAG: magnesium-transporting ATPase, partial [Leptolyngbyaceae cyanobacterium SL_7_1]|nr:magnesium-transporting ATPase [Leptolyngbyaceae cyanobacterium SL_7_1]
DGLPALALAVEPAEPDVMNRPPYSPRESIFARGLGSYMVRIGIVFGIVNITLMAIAVRYFPDHWKTMVFTTLCLAQMGHALAVRSQSQLTLELNPFSNVYVWAAVIVTTLLQLTLIYVAPLRDFFGTYWLSPLQLGICVGCSALIFVWLEAEKLWMRFAQSRRTR